MVPSSLIAAFSLVTISSLTYHTESFISQVPTIPTSLQRRSPMLVEKDSSHNDVFDYLPSLDQLSSTSSISIGSSTDSENGLFFANDILRKSVESLQTSTSMRNHHSNDSTAGISSSNPLMIQKFRIPEKFFSDYSRKDADKKSNKKMNKETIIENEFKKHGMPWKTSIEPTHNRPHLFYMPLWEMQMEFMKEHLTNLRPLPVTTRDGSRDLSYVEKTDGNEKVRMSTLAFTCDEFRKIRMTFYDAGNQTQIFTSLWYPQPHLGNLPLFGTDFLQFNQDRHLCIVDLQPLNHDDNNQGINSEDHLGGNNLASSFDYENEILKPIRDQYPSLQEKMTNRFYDENRFFSKQMLLGRFEQVNATSSKKSNYEHAHGLVHKDLMPAYQQYLESYLKIVQSAAKAKSQNHLTNFIIDGQRQHDEYHAVSDPGHALFKGQFGKQFADDYVHDILFSYSDRKGE